MTIPVAAVTIPEEICTVPKVEIPLTYKSVVSTLVTSISPPLMSTVPMVATPVMFKFLPVTSSYTTSSRTNKSPPT